MAIGQKFGRNAKKCERYAAQRRADTNKARRAKARAKRLVKRASETAARREERALRSHQRRHLLHHGLPATEQCALCRRAQ